MFLRVRGYKTTSAIADVALVPAVSVLDCYKGLSSFAHSTFPSHKSLCKFQNGVGAAVYGRGSTRVTQNYLGRQ
jgi:hypothetical protein